VLGVTELGLGVTELVLGVTELVLVLVLMLDRPSSSEVVVQSPG